MKRALIIAALLLGAFMASPSAQSKFWVLVNGSLKYTGNVTVTGTQTISGALTAASVTSTGAISSNATGVALNGSGSLFFANTPLLMSTAPTISSGFGTSPAILSSNGAATFRVNVGTGAVATSGVVAMPTATTGWNCQVTDFTNNTVTRETAATTATVTVTAAAAWAASDTLIFNCAAY